MDQNPYKSPTMRWAYNFGYYVLAPVLLRSSLFRKGAIRYLRWKNGI